MNDVTRTLIYVIVAALIGGVMWWKRPGIAGSCALLRIDSGEFSVTMYLVPNDNISCCSYHEKEQ